MKLRYLILFLSVFAIASCSSDKESEDGQKDDKQKNPHPNVEDTVSSDGFKPITGTLTFSSQDGLSITADVYEIDSISPWLVLCHQAGWSRGEYRETAHWLNKEGFNCIAIDQRSGGKINDVVNETAARAEEKGLKTDYIDAEPDIEAAVQFVDILAEGREQKLVLVGSSYSSALVLKITGEQGDDGLIDGVASFSPGEYFPNTSIGEAAAKIDVPVFITAAGNEIAQTTEVSSKVPEEHLTLFYPDGEGIHGARALWLKSPESDQYRREFLDFLQQFKN